MKLRPGLGFVVCCLSRASASIASTSLGHPRPLVGGHGLGTRPDINSTLSRKCVDRIRAYSTICGAAVSSLAQ
ncbi:hypothetical protein C8R44DRAFT_822313, partial [Mycena epipterygia]